MKKLKVLISAALTTILLTGCGSSKTAENPSTNNNNSTTTSTKDVEKINTSDDKKDGYEKSDMLTLQFDDRMLDFTIDIPPGQSYISAAGQIDEGKDFYVAIDQYADEFAKQYGYTLEQMKSAKDIFSAMQKQFMAVSRCVHLSKNNRVVTIEKTEDKKINGYDMCKFQGTIKVPDDEITSKQCQFVGYSTFYKEKPMYFVIVDKSKDQSKKDYIGKVADAMAKTLRERKK